MFTKCAITLLKEVGAVATCYIYAHLDLSLGCKSIMPTCRYSSWWRDSP